MGSTKHYNTDYLEDTAALFKSLKEFSYRPFINISSGTVVDLGCGTGLDVLMMAKTLGESVKVVGIDHDPIMLEKGKQSSAELLNVEFILGEVYPLAFGNNSLAGVRAERLVQHLTNPPSVFDEVKRVLMPEATLVIVETDWPGLLFYNKHVKIERKIINYLSEQKVNNGYASRNLTSYLQDAGFHEIKLQVFPFVLHKLQQANEYLWLDKIIRETLEKQIITAEEYDLFLQELQQADERGYFACSMNMVVASGVKR